MKREDLPPWLTSFEKDLVMKEQRKGPSTRRSERPGQLKQDRRRGFRIAKLPVK